VATVSELGIDGVRSVLKICKRF